MIPTKGFLEGKKLVKIHEILINKTPKEDYITIINLLYLLCVSRSNRSIFSGNNLSLYMRASASASTFLAKTDTNLSYNLLLPLYYLALSTILWFPLSIPCG